jgi:hypothetical protein
VQRWLTYTLPRHMKSPIGSSSSLVEGPFPQAENNFRHFPHKNVSPEVSMRQLKKAFSYMLLVACLLLVAAGSVWANRQEKESQAASSSTESAPLNYEFAIRLTTCPYTWCRSHPGVPRGTRSSRARISSWSSGSLYPAAWRAPCSDIPSPNRREAIPLTEEASTLTRRTIRSGRH